MSRVPNNNLDIQHHAYERCMENKTGDTFAVFVKKAPLGVSTHNQPGVNELPSVYHMPGKGYALTLARTCDNIFLAG